MTRFASITSLVLSGAVVLGILVTPVQAPAFAQPPAQSGRIVFVSNQGGNLDLYDMAANGGAFSQLSVAPLADQEPAWSPDGTQLAYTTEVTPGQTELVIFNFETRMITLRSSFGAHVSHPVWSPDGARIIFASDHSGNNEVYLVEANGSGLVNLTANPADDRWPTWSPDGTQIVFQSDRDGDIELYLLSLFGNTLARLTNSPGPDRNPTWTPAGPGIAFISERSGNADIFMIDASGTPLVQMSNTPENDSDPAWSPSGQMLVFSGGVGPGVTELFTVQAYDTNPQQITSAGAQAVEPVWSPDGQWIAYASNAGGSFDIAALEVASGTQVTLTNLPNSDERSPVWTGPAASIGDIALLPLASATPEGDAFLPIPTATLGDAALPAPPTSTAQLPPTLTPEPTMTAQPVLPPTLTPQPPPTLTPNMVQPDLMLYYNAHIPSFDLVNVSGRKLNLTPLTFNGNGIFIGTDIWVSAGMSSSLKTFAEGGCLALWGLDATMQPMPPGCQHRHGWWGSDTVLFWTGNTFTVYYNSAPVAICERDAGSCPVSLSTPVSAVPPTVQAPAAAPVSASDADLLLVYNTYAPAFDLINMSGRQLNLTPLRFYGNNYEVDSELWEWAGMSSDLGSFAAGGCLSFWGLTTTMQPLPPECRHRHGWWGSDDVVFWTGGTFTVTYRGATVGTCETNTGRCLIRLP
ncbi:MAG: PD40 domain-containing protein [Anaerolineae bacterium]|nr:PD40 domain-containing protein [Anaerolineae bacterium]